MGQMIEAAIRMLMLDFAKHEFTDRCPTAESDASFRWSEVVVR